MIMCRKIILSLEIAISEVVQRCKPPINKVIPYSRLFSTVKYFVRKILGCIKFSMRLDRSKIKSYLKFVTP